MQLQYAKLMQQIRANPAGFVLQPYTQTFSIASLATGASTTVNSNIDSSAPFVWNRTTYFCDIAGALQTDANRVVPMITVQLTDTGSKRQLFDISQPFNNIAGYGGIPQLLEQPYLFQPNSNITGAFTCYAVAGTTYTNIFLTLLGYRIYAFEGALG